MAEFRNFGQSHELEHGELVFHIRILLALTRTCHELVQLLGPVPHIVLLHFSFFVGQQFLKGAVVFIISFAGHNANGFRDDSRFDVLVQFLEDFLLLAVECPWNLTFQENVKRGVAVDFHEPGVVLFVDQDIEAQYLEHF